MQPFRKPGDEESIYADDSTVEERERSGLAQDRTGTKNIDGLERGTPWTVRYILWEITIEWGGDSPCRLAAMKSSKTDERRTSSSQKSCGGHS